MKWLRKIIKHIRKMFSYTIEDDWNVYKELSQ
jgi:hypothetical protein